MLNKFSRRLRRAGDSIRPGCFVDVDLAESVLDILLINDELGRDEVCLWRSSICSQRLEIGSNLLEERVDLDWPMSASCHHIRGSPVQSGAEKTLLVSP